MKSVRPAEEKNVTMDDLPARTGLMVGLSAFALVASFLPVLSVPTAAAGLVMAIRRAKIPDLKFPVLAAMAMAGIALPIAIISAVGGARQASQQHDEMLARENIHRVHQKMDQVMAVEIESGKHMQQMVRQLAEIDVSACPADYQEVYREMIEVLTDLAFDAAQNEDLVQNVRIFFENLMKSFNGDMSGLEASRHEDEQLMRRMEQAENRLRLVCAKYGFAFTESGESRDATRMNQ